MAAPVYGLRRVAQIDAPTGDPQVSPPVLTDPYAATGRLCERLDHLFEARCDWITGSLGGDHLALDAGGLRLTYGELDARANRLARYLQRRGTRAGDRIGLLLDGPADACVAVLGVFKAGAAYVPLDAATPVERMARVATNARMRAVLSTSATADRVPRIELLAAGGAELVCLDLVARTVDEQDPRRLVDAGHAGDERIAYIAYPAGLDDPLAGVAVGHAALCTVIRGAAEVYDLLPSDRAYHGLPVAAPGAVEEMWGPWACGATLMPAPVAGLRGRELHAFLRDHRITALRCVPEVLATIEDDLPDLRFLLVTGGACPPDVVARWHRRGRRVLDGYAPDGTTTTAVWTELSPYRPPVVGVPLPGYCAVVLDTGDPRRALAHGETGEIGLAGVGLGCGYLRADDLPERRFVPDFLGIPANPSGRILRTGDLGRVTPAGEIEYLGRVELRNGTRPHRVVPTSPVRMRPVPGPRPSPRPRQVPIPVPEAAPPAPPAPAATPPPAPAAPTPTPPAAPARAAPVPAAPAAPALTATEQDLAAVLIAVLGVEEAPVDADFLGAHFFDDLGADSMVMARFCARLRKRPDLPSASMKDIYRHPTVRGLATALAPPAGEPLAPVLAEILAGILGAGPVPVDAHFFDDLGADSMLMARFCARVRKRSDLPAVSMKDVYRHPTVAALARALAGAAAPSSEPAAPVVPPDPLPDAPPRVGTAGYVLCGVLQLIFFLCYSFFAAVVMTTSYEWISAATGAFAVYARSVVAGGVAFVGLCALPIVAKWVLIGRWKRRRIRVWSLDYLRFWIVKILVRSNPLVLFVGSPLYVLYLRALGARVGRGVAILSRHVPVCTDLLRIGDGAVVLQESFLSCYRARAGVIETGPVVLGRDAFVAEATVLDIRTRVGDGAQLGRSSSLHAGQVVPDGARWHGSPARPTEVDYRTVDDVGCSTARRVVYSLAQLLNVVFVVLPLGFGGITVLLMEVPQLAALVAAGPSALTSTTFYRDAVVTASALFFGAILVGLLVVTTLPRLLNLALRPDKVYRLYGARYSIHRTIMRLTNVPLFTRLFGDSSYIVAYLRCLGYDLGRIEQSGSNFGTNVRQVIPYLSSVGSGTVVADGLSILNSSFSSTGFRVSRVSIGARNFLGNRIVYPVGGRTGENCLLATKVLVPIDGKVREGVGLLGSPPFEIPRTVERDTRFDALKSPDELRRRLRRKNVHNLVTIALFLLSRWIYVLGLVLLSGVALEFYDRYGVAAITLEIAATFFFTVGYFVVVERVVTLFHPLRPRYCSIYDRDFWRVERYWKVAAEAYLQALNGTPFKNLAMRALGVRLGRRVFDDGWAPTERAMCSVGDDCTLNAGSVIQPHSQEDGTFKSDRSALGTGVTLGVGAFVHYGVSVGEKALLSADSFLMKGEAVPAGAHWAGNPAVEIVGEISGKNVARTAGDVVVEIPGAAPAAPVDPDVADDRRAEPVTVGAGRP